MELSVTDRAIRWFRLLCILALVAGGASYVVFTIHWQWMWDTQVMHYIVLLLDHGKIPYRDIYDINMPGAYLTERWAIALFGPGDLGWRLYEYTLLATMTGAMIVIALPWDWLAGLFAGVLFIVQLGSLGPYQAVERDEVMTVLLFVAYALLFTAVRRRLPWLGMGFGLAIGMAILIKPTVLPLAFCLLLFLWIALRHRAIRAGQYLAWALAGLGTAGLILLAFLLPGNAFGAFFFILHKLVPYYSSLAHPSLLVLLRRSLPAAFVVYMPLTLILAFTSDARANWEMWAVRTGFVFGGLSYFIQGKGYDYHRIAFLCFGLLWIGIEASAALRDRGWRRAMGVTVLGFGVFFMVPFEALKIKAHHDVNEAAFVLQGDLQQLGGARLQNKVQCFDLVGGCLSALYRMGLVQSTGFTGDLQFFGPDDGSVVPYYRNILMQDLHRDPPDVIILSNEWYQESGYSFAKLNTWPAFRDYLNANYRLEAEQGPFNLYDYPMKYRIYVLRGYPGSLKGP
jgi:hypothetical protein